MLTKSRGLHFRQNVKPLTFEVAEINLGNFLAVSQRFRRDPKRCCPKKEKVKQRCINPLFAMKLLRGSFLQEQIKTRYVTFSCYVISSDIVYDIICNIMKSVALYHTAISCIISCIWYCLWYHRKMYDIINRINIIWNKNLISCRLSYMISYLL